MTKYVIDDTDVAAIVRYVVDREKARHQRMHSDGAKHAAVVTLRSFGLTAEPAKQCVDIAWDNRNDPIVESLKRQSQSEAEARTAVSKFIDEHGLKITGTSDGGVVFSCEGHGQYFPPEATYGAMLASLRRWK